MSSAPLNPDEKITVKFIETDGSSKDVDAYCGMSILDVAREHGIDLEGACEGSLACSTCHVIVQEEWYNKLSPASDMEEDMLDLAYGLTNTSRLGCQIILTKDMDGFQVELPKASRNLKLS
jgi:2Fe-2S ferredoxin